MSKPQKKEIYDCWNDIGVWSKTDKKCSILDKVVHCHNCVIYSNAGRELLDREPTENYFAEWQSVYSAPKQAEKKSDRSILVFRLGNEWFGMPTDILDEITDVSAIHSVPHRTSAVLRGLVNIRGKLTVCLSLDRLLNIERGSNEPVVGRMAIPRLIILRQDKEQYAFPVTEVLSIVAINSEEIEIAPSTVHKSSSAFVNGVYTHKTFKVGILDSKAIMSAINRNLL